MKKAIYFTQEFNPKNAPSYATCLTYDPIEGLKLIDDRLEVTISSSSDVAQTNEIQILTNKINELEKTITIMKVDNAGGTIETDTAITVTTVSGNIGNIDKDVKILGSETPITSVAKVTGKSIVIDGGNISTGGRLDLSSGNDVTITELNTTGTLEKSVSNASISVNNTSGLVSLANSTINQTSYNAIEIGLSTTSKPTNVEIKNVEFLATIKNNSISIFNTGDSAIIDIIGCKFVKCSNPIRISNRDNVKLTVNIIDCEFGEWETGEYSGMILCQDYTSKSIEAEATNNLFAPEKVTINIENCTKGDEKITAENFTFGDKVDSQILYVYYDKTGFIEYAGNESRYPIVNIK